MPTAPQKPCRHPRCAGFAAPGRGWCSAHAPLAREAPRARDERRGTAASRGYGHRWREESTDFRRKHPICGGYLTRSEEWSHEAAQRYAETRRVFAERAAPIAFLGSPERLAYCGEAGPYLLHRPACRGPVALVDHISPHRGDVELFWSEPNWQTLCKKCHDTKTARHDHAARMPQKKVAASEFTGGWA